MNAKPRRRDRDILTQESNDELLVYDLRTHKAFCLNSTSAFIWNICDGKKTISQISNEATATFSRPVDEVVIFLALDQLSKNDLIENRDEIGYVLNGLPRREVVKRLGAASVIVLPAIFAIVALRQFRHNPPPASRRELFSAVAKVISLLVIQLVTSRPGRSPLTAARKLRMRFSVRLSSATRSAYVVLGNDRFTHSK